MSRDVVFEEEFGSKKRIEDDLHIPSSEPINDMSAEEEIQKPHSTTQKVTEKKEPTRVISRIRTQPKWLMHEQTLFCLSCCEEDEPKTRVEALSSDDADLWQEAMNTEYKSL